MKHIVHLLSSSPLEIFDISSVFVGLSFNSLLEDELWTQLILTHGKSLLEFHVNRNLIVWEMIQSICVQCIKLEILCLLSSPMMWFIHSLHSCSDWKDSYSKYKYLPPRINWVLVYLSQRYWCQFSFIITSEYLPELPPSFNLRHCLF